MAMDEEKGKWLWGALGLAAGAGLAWWLFKKKSGASSPLRALPQQATSTPAIGTEGMMAAYAAENVTQRQPLVRTSDVVDAEFTVMKDRPGPADDGTVEEENGEF